MCPHFTSLEENVVYAVDLKQRGRCRVLMPLAWSFFAGVALAAPALAQSVRTLDVEKLEHSGYHSFSFDWEGNTQDEISNLYIDDIERWISLSPDSSGVSGKLRLYGGFPSSVRWTGSTITTEFANWINISGHPPLDLGIGAYHNKGALTKAAYEVLPRSGTADTRGVLQIDLGALYYDTENATMERSGPRETLLIRKYPVPAFLGLDEDLDYDILRIEYGRADIDYGPFGEFHATVTYYNRANNRIYTATFEDLGTAYLFLLNIPIEVGDQYQILHSSGIGMLFEQQINLIHGTSSELELRHRLLEASETQDTITGDFGYYLTTPIDPDGPVAFPSGVPGNLAPITFTLSVLDPEKEEG